MKPFSIKLHFSLLSVSISALLLSCASQPPTENAVEHNSNRLKGTHAVFGYYVTQDYNKRGEGYDWVSVRLAPLPENNEKLQVSIRSRADKKKPTCTFDAIATALNDSTYQTTIRNKKVLFTISKNQLTIATAEPANNDLLMYYCSSGGSIGGDYWKIETDIDRAQIDTSAFFKHLELQGIALSISGQMTADLSIITFSPSGLEIVNDTITMPFPGKFVGAETEDLNADGSPEFLIYMKDVENEQGYVIAYSVNNRKSMSQVYFPPISNDASINTGYAGNDQFVVTENGLSQRFPIAGTDSMRQINYEMVEGEATRMFKVKSTQMFLTPPPLTEDVFKSTQH